MGTEFKDLDIISTFKAMQTYFWSVSETLHMNLCFISLFHTVPNLLYIGITWISYLRRGHEYNLLSSVLNISLTLWSYITLSKNCKGLSAPCFRLKYTAFVLATDSGSSFSPSQVFFSVITGKEFCWEAALYCCGVW